MTRYSSGFKVLVTAAVAVVALSAAPAMAGPGKSGDHGGGGQGGGHGNSKADGQLANAKSQGGNSGQSHGNGTLASELKKLNGAIHASFTAWTHASSNSVPGLARTYAESTNALKDATVDVTALEADKQALLEEVSTEDYQKMIDELDVESPTYADDLAGLEALRDAEGTRSEEQITTDLAGIQGELDGYVDEQTVADDALQSLTGGRELSEEAMAALDARVEEYLASEEYQATLESDAEVPLVEEEVPVE